VKRGLPVDLLQDIARRLQILCAIVVIVATTGTLATKITGTGVPSPLRFGGVGALWLASLAVVLVVRRGRLSSERLLDLGMAYGVLVALIGAIVSVPANWFASARQPLLWSPVAVWVLIFPIVIPNTTPKTLLAASVAALTEPAAIMFYAAQGLGPFPAFRVFGRAMWGNLTAVGVAVLASRILYGLGEKLSAARSLGSYQLMNLLGEGGMGEVWRAEHRLLARPAAVKLIKPSGVGADSPLGAEHVFRRFEQEAQATAMLKSPHTITVYDFGLARDGTFYYVMELLDGMDLHQLVAEEGPQPPERVIYLLRQACHSLYEAHEHGLVHRDIKPGNLFLCRSGIDFDVLKVLDFGLVLPRSGRFVGDGKLEDDTAPTGTPQYMAPEAIMASAEDPVDLRVDIYALGCTAYWLLAGRDVFVKASAMALVVAHLNEAPPPLNSVAPEPVPAELEAVVMACLAKDPNDRPASALDLSNRLRAVGLEERWTEERRAVRWAMHDARSKNRSSGGVS
jgi:hypothetical protein